MMYTEKERIEDAIIPYLLMGICENIFRKEPKYVVYYAGLMKACGEFIDNCAAGQSRYHRDKMMDRLERLGKKITKYGTNNGFYCQKMLLMCIGWGHSLLKQRAVVISVKTNLWKEVKALYREIRDAHNPEEEGGQKDFAKIYSSAIKHAHKVQKIALDEGYFQ